MTNTKLWDSVFHTDPTHTKKFIKGGGFSGTAIKPFWLIKRATETFGICGIGWGWEEIENKMVAGVWCSKVRVWFNYDGSKGDIQQWGQTVMEGTNKNGAFVDEEAPKKAVTDAVTKCLSYLGFAGDVHMGKFDDSKYYEENKKEFIKKGNNAATMGDKTANEIYGSSAAWGRAMDKIEAYWLSCKTLAELERVAKENKIHLDAVQQIDPECHADMQKKYKAHKLRIEQDKMIKEQLGESD